MKGLKVRLPDDLHTRLLQAATADKRSLNSMILVLLGQALDLPAETWKLMKAADLAMKTEGVSHDTRARVTNWLLFGQPDPVSLPPEIAAQIAEGRAHPELRLPYRPRTFTEEGPRT